MNIKDFFRLLIKIFGLYLFITLLIQVVQSISYISLDFGIGLILISVGTIGLSVAILYYLFTQGDAIINFLKLDKGFDNEEMHITGITMEHIIALATLFLGGSIIANNLPDFIYNCFLAFKEKITDHSLSVLRSVPYTVNYSVWFKDAFMVVTGYLMITNYRRITLWMTKNNKN